MQTIDQIADLPVPVRRSLDRSGALEQPVPNEIRVAQVGRLLMGRRWFPFSAKETYATDPVGFEWSGTVTLGGIPLATARDSLSNGRGRMHVRLLGVFTVVDESGPEMAQGSLMRWLNETMWFPQVWATDLITWTPLDETAALGSITVGDQAASAVFHFDRQGRLSNFRADRYRIEGETRELQPWSTPIDEYGHFNDVELPCAGRAAWGPAGSEVGYIRMRLSSVEYL